MIPFETEQAEECVKGAEGYMIDDNQISMDELLEDDDDDSN